MAPAAATRDATDGYRSTVATAEYAANSANRATHTASMIRLLRRASRIRAPVPA